MEFKISILALALTLVGCGTGGVDVPTVAAQGAPVSATVRELADGTLHADKLLVTKGTADGDDVECEDGLTPDGQACDDGDDGAEDQGAEDDAGTQAFLQGTPMPDDVTGQYKLLGLAIDPGVVGVPDGAARFAGVYQGGGTLVASTVQQAKGSLALGGVSEGVDTIGAHSWTLHVMGLSLLVDGATEIVPVSNPIDGQELEGSGGDDADGVNCEQQGQHEGDNEGC